MIGTGCLRSWFRCCGAVALTAFFALNSTSAWAIDFANAPKKEFGSGDVTKYYEWAQQESGIYILNEVAEPTDGKASIIVKHSSQTSDRIAATDETEISGTFVNNEIINPSNGEAWGAGVYVPQASAVEKITGTFIGNNIENGDASYGAGIANTYMDAIKEIDGVFVGNKTISYNDGVNSGGAAISNNYVVEKISGDFVGNIAFGTDTAVGGAIIDNGGNTKYSGNFIGNTVISAAPNDGSGAFFGYDGSLGGAIIMGLGGLGSEFNNANFYGNQAISLAPQNGLAWGGVLYAWVDSLNFNNSVFDSNKAYAKTGNALGGAMFLQSDITTYNNVIFRNNIVQSDGDGGYASGGAIKNGYGYMGLTNTSFYNNQAIATGENGWADGGAITFDQGLLEIVADNGRSEISGNKVITKDGEGNLVERDEGIYLGNGATLDLIAMNNGVIKIDDEINRYGETGNVTYQDQAWFEQLIEDLKTQDPNASVEKIGNKYVIKASGIIEGLPTTATMEVKKYSQGYILTNLYYKISVVATYDLITSSLNGIQCNKDKSYCFASATRAFLSNFDYQNASVEAFKKDDGSYLVEQTIRPVESQVSTPNTLVISGDETGRVELNNAINGFRGVEVFDTNVFFGEKSLINYALDVFSGSVNGAIIENNGIMNVSAGAVANDTVVNLGGLLKAEAQAKLNNLLANAGSKLELDTDTILQGEVVIHKDADVSGSTYDFGKIFSNTNLEVNSLTVVGGINDVFVEDDVSKLVNEDLSKDKGLTLEGGEYSLANVIKEGSTQVAGWDVINIKASESAPATIVKLESDIELVGSNKKINLGENAVLDVSGHSPLEITIDGSLENSGLVNFWHETDDADDKVTIKGNYNAKSGAQVLIDINSDTNKADKIVVEGDVSGTTEVIGEATSDAKPSEKILFVEAPNDNPDTGASFKVSYVNGSVYKWNTIYDNNAWYIGTSDIVPDGSVNGYEGVQGDAGNNGGLTVKPLLRPEMIAYMGLYDAGFEQTASLNRVIAENVGKNQLLGKGCRGTLCREINPVRNAWVAPVHQNLDIDAPYKYEAKISGIDAGIDINSDGINKWGVLASYRKGNYEFDGQGDKYYSDEGSEIDIDSYVMGLYFRRDKYNTKIAGTIYAGMQKAEISSDDGAKAKTDALEIGASLDVSHIFEVAKDVTIAPELQISYQMLDYDNIKDNAGKKVQLEAAHRITAEVGAKLEKKWMLDAGKAAIYIKPSVIQTIHGGGKLNVKGLDSIHTTEDRTLGRFEIGAEYEVNTRWSVGASAAHTFGSDYKDTTFSLDAKYRF